MNSKKIIKRHLNIKLPRGRSAFLWGARKTGKSTLLKNYFPKSIYLDFLNNDLFFDFIKNPSLLREKLATIKSKPSFPIILDEVQKIPNILDEVHWLIENQCLSFILCGSSARKLKRGQANLLGGRAWRYELYPFTYPELSSKNFNLCQALNRGLIPSHYFDKYYKKSLKAYIQDYIREEIMSEGLTRNIPAFSTFLDSLGYSHGELTNFLNISRECGIDSKTVKEYYQILIDTLIGKFVLPFKRHSNRQILTQIPKFYLFDVGIANFLSKRVVLTEKGASFGKAFEHFIYLELNAYSSYSEANFPINFWRTKTGQEVDFILGQGEIAIEVKGKTQVNKSDIKSLIIFQQEYKPKKCILVYTGKHIRKIDNIYIWPYKTFLETLWQKKLIT